jgi:hypothetical protein
MKKVLSFLFVAAVAAFVLVSCSKPKTPAKQDKDSKEQDSGKEDEGKPQDEEPAKLAVDGKFGEWADIAPVEGEDAIILMKAQMDDSKIYFYIEADAQSLCNEDSSYSNYLTIYIDCGSDSSSITYWGGEEGCKFDVAFQVWLMQKAKASMANWDTGFAGRAKIEDGVYRAEFCWSRATDMLKESPLYFGAYLKDQYVEYPEDGASEGAWIDGEDVGFAPAKGEDMARIK